MIGCLRTRVCKQPIIALYFESENELKLYSLEARAQYPVYVLIIMRETLACGLWPEGHIVTIADLLEEFRVRSSLWWDKEKSLSSHSMSRDQPAILHSFFPYGYWHFSNLYPAYVYWHNVSVHVWKKALQDKRLISDMLWDESPFSLFHPIEDLARVTITYEFY